MGQHVGAKDPLSAMSVIVTPLCLYYRLYFSRTSSIFSLPIYVFIVLLPKFSNVVCWLLYDIFMLGTQGVLSKV